MRQKKLIFVVDDEISMRYSLERYLCELGFEVNAISDGFDVLVMCLYLIPDLIISDIHMPKLDGIALLQGLKNNNATKDIPIIFMTAYETDIIIQNAKNLGAKCFLFKPFPLTYLEDVLHRALPVLFKNEEENDVSPKRVD